MHVGYCIGVWVIPGVAFGLFLQEEHLVTCCDVVWTYFCGPYSIFAWLWMQRLDAGAGGHVLALGILATLCGRFIRRALLQVVFQLSYMGWPCIAAGIYRSPVWDFCPQFWRCTRSFGGLS